MPDNYNEDKIRDIELNEYLDSTDEDYCSVASVDEMCEFWYD